MAIASRPHHTIIAAAYFFLSAVITWWFILRGAGVYHYDMGKMILSCSIAGAKWAIQIVAAMLFLGDRRWLFIRQIGLTCFAGSCLLLPYCFGVTVDIGGVSGFLLSLILAVLCMLILYYRGVRVSRVALKWYFFWVVCLAIAISLQLTVVFHMI